MSIEEFKCQKCQGTNLWSIFAEGDNFLKCMSCKHRNYLTAEEWKAYGDPFD